MWSTDETAEAQLLDFILYVPLVALTEFGWVSEWLTKLFRFLSVCHPSQFAGDEKNPSILSFLKKGNFEIPYSCRKQCNSFLSHTQSPVFSTSSFTPAPTSASHLSLPLSPLSPHCHQQWSKDSSRFTHTQLHRPLAVLRSGAVIWKSHTEKCEVCVHARECVCGLILYAVSLRVRETGLSGWSISGIHVGMQLLIRFNIDSCANCSSYSSNPQSDLSRWNVLVLLFSNLLT